MKDSENPKVPRNAIPEVGQTGVGETTSISKSKSGGQINLGSGLSAMLPMGMSAQQVRDALSTDKQEQKRAP